MVNRLVINTDLEPSDEELVTRCQIELPHNTQSYELLVQRHMNQVYRTAYQLVVNQEDAEDIMQDVFLKVYNNVGKFKQQASFSTWLYRITTNTALDSLDKKRSHAKMNGNPDKKQTEENDQDESQPSGEDGPEETSLQKELRECINNVFKKMGREQAEVLIMRDLNNLSYDEISDALGARLSAVKMRIHRARLSFQQIYLQVCDQARQVLSMTSPQPMPSQEKKGKSHGL